MILSLMDIAAGCDYLHSLGVLHSDLKFAPPKGRDMAFLCLLMACLIVAACAVLHDPTLSEVAGCLLPVNDVACARCANVLLKTVAPSSYDQRGFICKVRLTALQLMRQNAALAATYNNRWPFT